MGRSFPLRWTRPVALSDSLLRDPLLLSVCFAITTLPLEISGLWFPTSLINFSRLGMLAAILIVAHRAALGRSIVVPPRPLLIGAATVIAVDVASTLASGWPNATRELGPLLFYAVFAFAVVQALTDRRRVLAAAACLLAAGAAEAALILAQEAGDFYLTQIREFAGRRNGTFVEPNIAARFLVLAVVVALAAARRPFAMRPTRAIAVAALLTVAIVLTLSRSGWLLLVLVALAWVVIGRRDPRAWLGAGVVVATFVGGLVAVPNALTRASDVPAPASGATPAYTAVVAPARASARALTASLEVGPPRPGRSQSAEPPAGSTPLDGILNAAPIDVIRRYLARAGVAMFLDHLLTGVGLGGFQPMILGPYFQYIPLGYQPQPVSLAHTDLIRIAAEEGLIGLAAFAVFAGGIGATIWRGGRRGRDELDRVAIAAVGLGILVVFLAAQTEGRFFNDPYLWLLVGTLGALAAMARQAQPGRAVDIIPGNPSSR
jgi:O-antigen ligase